MPAVLRQVEALERFLARQPGVGGPEALHHLWHNYGVVRREARLRRLVDAGAGGYPFSLATG